MQKTILQTNDAPLPIGPYSQAVQMGNFLFVSGQIALHPHTGNLVADNIEDETQRVMLNLQAILHTAGLGFEHVVKTTIFLLDMNNFAQINQVYGSYFVNNFPARETVEVRGLPKNVNVEISVIAIKS